jgi:multisubunit Na+/H+ antiporter MnhB subunit
VARVVANAVLYIGTLFSLVLLLSGHNEPGGGFIAGTMTASVFAVLYVIFGKGYVESRFRIDYTLIAALGLVVAVGIALLPLALGLPVLSSIVLWDLDVPLLGSLKLVSAVVFDIGVYLTVVGAILAIFRIISGAEMHE